MFIKGNKEYKNKLNLNMTFAKQNEIRLKFCWGHFLLEGLSQGIILTTRPFSDAKDNIKKDTTAMTLAKNEVSVG